MSPVEFSHLSLWARDTAEEIKSAPETFSSWDKCMDKTYCKWPVIVGIIVGGVIILSIIACIVNCLCCGIQCCTGCCGCCCPSPRPKRPKYADDPYRHQPPPMPQMPPPNHGYQGGYQAPQAPPTYRGAQIARFDTPSSPGLAKTNDDALPAMPSWDSAVTRRVEDTNPHSDAMEMEPLNPVSRPPHRTPSAPRTNAGGYMGPPPIRTGSRNDYIPDPHGYDDQNPYDYRSQGPGHSPASPYDPPYRDHSPGGNYHAVSPPPNARFSPQPQYPIGVAVSPTTEMSRPIPYRQPSPGFSQQPPSYRGMSPSIPSSPPPPFSMATNHEVSDPGRPPSLLQSGPKPAPNTYRDV
ncbi:uncharacterized protein BJX67DRAFT_212434 [Aspergillus lucknowensis]|uniref:Uncharacterized protein n=1 Tax=Aspergillus lucknowensis TaxID=176173 RepID=A0ABR4M2F7_9EURO